MMRVRRLRALRGGAQPLQRVQVPVRGHARRTVPHAVVRPAAEVHAAQGRVKKHLGYLKIYYS